MLYKHTVDPETIYFLARSLSETLLHGVQNLLFFRAQ